MEAEDSDSEDAVLSSEEEEDSAEVLLVFPPYDGFGGGAACKRREREQTGEVVKFIFLGTGMTEIMPVPLLSAHLF